MQTDEMKNKQLLFSPEKVIGFFKVQTLTNLLFVIFLPPKRQTFDLKLRKLISGGC